MSRALVDLRTPRAGAHVITALIGIAILVGCWQLVGALQLVGSAIPSLTDAIAGLVEGRMRGVLVKALAATLPRAALALVIGTVAGILLAMIPVMIRHSATTVNRIAALLNALPVIVMAPILVTLLGVSAVPTFLGALFATFAVFVTVSAGLTAAPASADDYFASAGSGRWQRFILLQAPAALPSFFRGLSLATGAALGGVMFGEWFGSPDGVGMLLMSTMRTYQTVLLWSTAICVTLVGILAYLLFAAVGRLIALRFAS